MRKSLVVIATAGILVGITPAAGLAAGNEQSGPTVGNCLSDIFYGNEPNMVGPFSPGGPAEQEPGSKAGRVVPSQSPGPKVTNPVTGEVTVGSSVGDFQQQGVSIPALCRAAFGPND